MIVFDGELSEACKRDLQNKICKYRLTVACIITLVLIIIPFVVAISLGKIDVKYIPLLIVAVIIIVVFNLPLTFLRKSQLDKFKDNIYVSISQGQLVGKGFDGATLRDISQVKKVIKTDRSYYIVFYHADISTCWICPKELLVEGTTEQFEKIFQDKLIDG